MAGAMGFLTLISLPASLLLGRGVGAGGRMRWLVVGALGFFAACPVTVRLAVRGREDDVPLDHAFDGMVGAWVCLAIAVLVCFGIGAAIGFMFTSGRQQTVAVAIACVVLAAPALFAAAVIELIVVDATECPPDAYECPI